MNFSSYLALKLHWDNRHRLHASVLQQSGCHGNYSDTSITPLSLDVLSSYLAWDFLGTLNISQIIRYYGYWVAMATTVIPQLLLCLKLYRPVFDVVMHSNKIAGP